MFSKNKFESNDPRMRGSFFLVVTLISCIALT